MHRHLYLVNVTYFTGEPDNHQPELKSVSIQYPHYHHHNHYGNSTAAIIDITISIIFFVLYIVGLILKNTTSGSQEFYADTNIMYLILACFIGTAISSIILNVHANRQKFLHRPRNFKKLCPVCNVLLVEHACPSCGGSRCRECGSWNEKDVANCIACNASILE